jgi:hypothetical protein
MPLKFGVIGEKHSHHRHHLRSQLGHAHSSLGCQLAVATAIRFPDEVAPGWHEYLEDSELLSPRSIGFAANKPSPVGDRPIRNECEDMGFD